MFFFFFYFFSLNQFVFLVEVSCFIGGDGFVSAAKLGRARLVCWSLRRHRGGVRARDAGATRRAKGENATVLVYEDREFVVRVSDRVWAVSFWTKPDSIIYARCPSDRSPVSRLHLRLPFRAFATLENRNRFNQMPMRLITRNMRVPIVDEDASLKIN